MRCNCIHGEYHGCNPGRISTIYFWCPLSKTHACIGVNCVDFTPGTPKKFDKRGNELGGNNDN